MNRGKNLVKNTIIYAVGNFGSKIMAYVMVLVYSHFLHTSELGYYDVVLTTVGMLAPIIMLQINDATYRFMADANEDKKNDIVQGTFIFLMISCGIFSLLFAIINSAIDIEFPILIWAYTFTLILMSCAQEAVRGYSNIKLYATVGIINSLITLICEFIGLVILHYGVEVLFISKIFASVVCIIIIFNKTPLGNSIVSIKLDNAKHVIIKELLKYSIPLVPNVICWWVMNSSDRYIILHNLGNSANGIYAMANKFPTILTTVTSVFYLAWQESAIKEYNSPSRNQFFSNVFEKYFKLLFGTCLLLVPLTKIAIIIFVSNEYLDSWKYTSQLIIAAAFSSLCSFQGIGYQISKETVKSLYTTIITAIINILINICLIKIIGLHAASVSTLIAYIILYVIRIFHTRAYYKIDYKPLMQLRILFINAAVCFLTWKIESVFGLAIISVIGAGLFLLFNKSFISSFVRIKRHGN